MPEYRAHLAGAAPLVVEFGEPIDRQFRAWNLALERRPAEVCREDIAAVIGIAG